MSRRTLRQRAAELLEPRHLLAGLVKVALVEGNLLIEGDQEDNGFRVAMVADPAGEKPALAIIPDETTAINDLPAGTQLLLPAVQLRNVRILPGDGADEVGVRGLSVEGGLQIENRGGHDAYKIAESEFGLYLKMTSPVARSKVELSDIVVVKKVDKASPVLFMRSVSGNNLDLKATNLKVGGSMDWKLNDSPGEVDLSRVEIDGRLSVVSNGALSDLTIEESQLGRAIDKSTPLIAKGLTKNMNVSATQLQVGGSMVSTFGHGGGGGAGKVIMQDVHFDGRLDISSLGVPLNVSIDGATAAAAYLKLSGIKGESTDSKHKNEIHIESFSWGSSLRVEATGPTALTMKKSGGGEAYLRIKMEDVLVSSFNVSESKFEDGLRVETRGGTVDAVIADTTVEESLSLNFTKIDFKYRPQKQNSSVELQKLEIGGGLRVESDGPLDLTGQGVTAVGGVYLKISGYDLNPGTPTGESHITLSDLDIGGRLFILGGYGSEAARIERLRVRERAVILLGGGDDSLAVVDSVFAGPALFDGGEGEDALTLSGNKFEAGRMLLNWEKIDETTDSPILTAGGDSILPLAPPQGRAGPGKR